MDIAVSARAVAASPWELIGESSNGQKLSFADRSQLNSQRTSQGILSPYFFSLSR